MGYKRVPPVKIVLDSETYNVLLTSLDDWSRFEHLKDNSFYKQAKQLSEKIKLFSRVFSEENEERVRICFFENEAGVLAELLVISLYRYTVCETDYFQQLKERLRTVEQNRRNSQNEKTENAEN